MVRAVGSLESLQPLLEASNGNIDHSLADKILMPGFIDPHVHPTLPAVLTQFPFLAPDDWTLPTGNFPGATTPADYEAQLRVLAAAHADETVPFVAWGYHPLWHGDISKAELNDWFDDQPVIIWHRSFHELILNDEERVGFLYLRMVEAWFNLLDSAHPWGGAKATLEEARRTLTDWLKPLPSICTIPLEPNCGAILKTSS